MYIYIYIYMHITLPCVILRRFQPAVPRANAQLVNATLPWMDEIHFAPRNEMITFLGIYVGESNPSVGFLGA